MPGFSGTIKKEKLNYLREVLLIMQEITVKLSKNISYNYKIAIFSC